MINARRVLCGFLFFAVLVLTLQFFFSETATKLQDEKIEWCSDLHFLGNKKAGKDKLTKYITALASFPGSGNTWARYLLQQATGVYTGSVYSDSVLNKKGFKGSLVTDRSVLFVKTHRTSEKQREIFDQAVLIVRDPAEAILSEYNRQQSGKTSSASEEMFKGEYEEEWERFVEKFLGKWKDTALAWTKRFKKPLLIIYYDELKANVEENLRRMINFVDYPIDENLMNCTMARQTGAYKRPKKKSTFDPFTPEMRQMINDTRDYVYRKLRRDKHLEFKQ